jgi:hypothetical protein
MASLSGTTQTEKKDSSLSESINNSNKYWETFLLQNANEFHFTTNSSFFPSLTTSTFFPFDLHSNRNSTSSVPLQHFHSYKNKMNLLFRSLHLLYETYKLNIATISRLHFLAHLLLLLSLILGFVNHIDYYLRDFPELLSLPNAFHQFHFTFYTDDKPPSIYQWLSDMMRGVTWIFPLLRGSPFEPLRQVCSLYHLMLAGSEEPKYALQTPIEYSFEETNFEYPLVGYTKGSVTADDTHNKNEKIVLSLVQQNITIQQIDLMPFGIAQVPLSRFVIVPFNNIQKHPSLSFSQCSETLNILNTFM